MYSYTADGRLTKKRMQLQGKRQTNPG